MTQPENTTRAQAQPSQSTARPTASHRLSSASTASSFSMQRTGSQGSQGSTDRSQWEKMTYGRHSGDVCLNNAIHDVILTLFSGSSPHKKPSNDKAPAALNHNIRYDFTNSLNRDCIFNAGMN